MASVQESVDVDVPITVAYDQWTQFESFPQFMGGVERITQLDATHTHWVTNVDGVKREFVVPAADGAVEEQPVAQIGPLGAQPLEPLLARDIAERHGGGLALDSRAPEGARFVVTLPGDRVSGPSAVGRA